MRKRIVAGNWKMNTTISEGLKLASEVVNMYKDEVTDKVGAIVAPPLTHLSQVLKLTQGSEVGVAAQNCHFEKSGAYTGEVSAPILKDMGVTYVILGHSERREYFHETEDMLKKKVDSVLEEGLTPIFCCGESLEVREGGDPYTYVKKQLTDSLFHLSEIDFSKLILAYEPIWAIGTGKTATSEQAQQMHAELRSHITEKYGETISNNITILYGGSCKPGNAKELFEGADVDGGLIGGASLKSRDFIDIIKSF